MGDLCQEYTAGSKTFDICNVCLGDNFKHPFLSKNCHFSVSMFLQSRYKIGYIIHLKFSLMNIQFLFAYEPGFHIQGHIQYPTHSSLLWSSWKSLCSKCERCLQCRLGMCSTLAKCSDVNLRTSLLNSRAPCTPDTSTWPA